MKQKILVVMALLCTVVQGAWADRWDGSSTEKPNVEGNSRTNVTARIRNAAQFAYIKEHWDDEAIVVGSFERYHLDYKELNYILDCDLDMTVVDWVTRKDYQHFELIE